MDWRLNGDVDNIGINKVYIKNNWEMFSCSGR